MTNKIQRTIDLVVGRKLAVEQQPDFCLRVARQVVEAANGWGGGEFFNKINFWDYRTKDNLRLAPNVPWARSTEEAFIRQGWTVPAAQARAGDLVFSRVPALQGHIGVLGTGPDGALWVLENATVRRGTSLGGAVNWVPLSRWGTPTTVGRLPDAWVYEQEVAPVLVPRPAAGAPVLAASPQRVVVTDGQGGFVDRTGQRVELPLGDGRVLVINDTDPNTTWIDVRGAR